MTVRLIRIKSVVTGLRPGPTAAAVRPVAPRTRWNGYFVYAPAGTLSAAHRYTLERLRTLAGSLVVVCATSERAQVPAELTRLADAVYWKALDGYDFSAYGLVLREIATRSPGADLLLLNDSVLGPFGELDAQLAAAPWQLTGFTGWSAFENHVQSYALFFRNVTAPMVRALRTVLPRAAAFNYFQHVVNCQETRLARVAARSMSVGALWFEPGGSDPSIARAVPLIDAGFPFLKRSLVGGKLAHRADRAQLTEFLRRQGHPL